jgi:hypothetical protein
MKYMFVVLLVINECQGGTAMSCLKRHKEEEKQEEKLFDLWPQIQRHHDDMSRFNDIICAKECSESELNELKTLFLEGRAYPYCAPQITKIFSHMIRMTTSDEYESDYKEFGGYLYTKAKADQIHFLGLRTSEIDVLRNAMEKKHQAIEHYLLSRFSSLSDWHSLLTFITQSKDEVLLPLLARKDCSYDQPPVSAQKYDLPQAINNKNLYVWDDLARYLGVKNMQKKNSLILKNL